MAMQQGQFGSRQALLTQVWGENPIFRQVLGICSALAVTNRTFNTLLMCGGLIWATTMSSLTVSLLRNYVPKRVRIMVSVLIIAVYVIVVDIVLRAFFTQIHKDIAAYVGLIITNCIILGRAEAFAMKNGVVLSFLDGLGNGLGYSVVLLVVAATRELLGAGSLFGYPLLPLTSDGGWYPANGLMLLPPSAFFIIGLLIWAVRSWKPAQVEHPEYQIHKVHRTEIY
jgi:Na+-transporting NADH:ubiquinone oxidoreductase subunit D